MRIFSCFHFTFSSLPLVLALVLAWPWYENNSILVSCDAWSDGSNRSDGNGNGNHSNRNKNRLNFENQRSSNLQEQLNSEKGVIPITVLSGFLGSGKTTVLQYLLQNKEDLKIAVIVNDVASVNIDSKLVRQSTLSNSYNDTNLNMDNAVNVIQLENGCVCCSLADELLGSVAEVVTLSDMRSMSGNDDNGKSNAFDHIVIELSGVSEPQAVRANFQEACMYGMPLMERVRLDTMITVIDCSTFGKQLKSDMLVNEMDKERKVDQYDDAASKIMEILSPMQHESEVQSIVSELLIDQTEVADVILLNKADTVEMQELDQINEIVKAINPSARLERTIFGKLSDINNVFDSFGGRGAADAGILDDHRDAVAAAKAKVKSEDHNIMQTNSIHSHDHEHDHKHEHEHKHDHKHDHKHEHELHICSDDNCNDPTHDHSHKHDHSKSQQEFVHKIGSFVYSARKPFHPQRLAALITKLPITRGKPNAEGLEAISPTKSQEIFQNLLRSKGFAWLACSNVAAYYWAHAGAAFEMQVGCLSFVLRFKA